MISQEEFNLIKNKYGHYASWAVWANEGVRPKDNMGDLNIFNPNENIDLLKQLNPNIILVGLNISRRIRSPLANFHDSRSMANDFKIRYALKKSPFWGAYMTDIIKDFEQKISDKLMKYLRKNSEFEAENIKIFREEIKDLGVTNPKIIAFGGDTHKILTRNFNTEFIF
jgi:hypothetical protein